MNKILKFLAILSIISVNDLGFVTASAENDSEWSACSTESASCGDVKIDVPKKKLEMKDMVPAHLGNLLKFNIELVDASLWYYKETEDSIKKGLVKLYFEVMEVRDQLKGELEKCYPSRAVQLLTLSKGFTLHTDTLALRFEEDNIEALAQFLSGSVRLEDTLKQKFKSIEYII